MVIEIINKRWNLNKWLTIILVICSIFSFVILTYILVALPFPPSFGTDRNAWVSFFGSYFGCIAGGLIGGAFAYFIMAYQIKRNNETIEFERREKIKKELELKLMDELIELNTHLGQEVISFKCWIKFLSKITIKDTEGEDFENFSKMISELEECRQNILDYGSMVTKKCLARKSILKNVWKEVIEVDDFRGKFLEPSFDFTKTIRLIINECEEKGIKKEEILFRIRENSKKNTKLIEIVKLYRIKIDEFIDILQDEFLNYLFDE